jgi:hypothetical protein
MDSGLITYFAGTKVQKWRRRCTDYQSHCNFICTDLIFGRCKVLGHKIFPIYFDT